MSKIFTVTLPDIGEGVVEGEVIQWLKNPGDPIQQDEPIVIVMTDKATVELPAPYPGKLGKQYFAAGQIAIKDKPLYDIELEANEVVSPASTRNLKVSESSYETAEETASKPKDIENNTHSSQKGLATPYVRKMAKDLNIDLAEIKSTGKDGRVTIEDLKTQLHTESKKLSHSPVHELPNDEIKPIIGIKNLMAHKMAESKAIIPHFTYQEQFDATRLVQLRQKFKEEAEKEGYHVTFIPFIIKALSMTITKFPEINSSIDLENKQLIIHKQQNIGIAMSTSLGLIVPVIKNVQELSLIDIVKSYEELKNKAIKQKLTSQDMKEATITISNFGVLGGGGMWATPIINYPEAAILALAKIQKQPIVKNGQLLIRDVLNLSWSFDHRIVDGDMAANCSHYFATLLQNPAPLL